MAPRPAARPARRRQLGLSLIELMISMAIGLFLLAGLVGIFVNSSQSSAELSKSAQQIENGRFAMQTIVDDLSLAGFFGHYYYADVPAGIANPCDATAAGLKQGMQVPVLGVAGGGAMWSPNTCLPDANRVAGTGVLVVRRAGTKQTTGADFVVGETYLQANSDPTDGNNPLVTVATTTAGPMSTFLLKLRDAATAAPVRKMHVHIYFVSPCSQPLVCTGASTDDGIPTLKRLELVNGAFVVVPLAEGIENLQFEYGVDTDGDGAPETPFYADATSAPTGTAAEKWANVAAVQVHLLARNVESSPGFTDTKTYNLGAATSVTPGGPYKRHAYSALVRVVNPSARKETP